MKIVITLPAYNEEKDIGRTVSEIRKVMDSEKYDYKLIVYNDGSEDNTAKIAKEKGAAVFSNKANLGLAETFKKEMEICLKEGADIIVHTDADGQYPAKYIPQLIEKVKKGNDLVLGSRFGSGSYSGSFIKSLGNRAFAMVFSGVLKTKITDTTTGFRAFTKEVAKLPLINTFTYTQEQIIRARKCGMRIAEVPIKANKTRKSRLFKNSLDYAVKAWINILRIYRDFAPLKFFGGIGLFFMALGIILGGFIIHSWIATGSVGAVPRVILSMLLITTGVQIGLFGFLADMLKK